MRTIGGLKECKKEFGRSMKCSLHKLNKCIEYLKFKLNLRCGGHQAYNKRKKAAKFRKSILHNK
jgi:hypothetical protein